MAIIINTKLVSTEIPVTIGALNYTFDSSDAALEKVYKVMDELSTMINAHKDEVTAKEVAKKGFESLLGEGCYEEIYKQTPSGIRTFLMLYQVAQELEKEMGLSGFKVQSEQEKAEKYIKHKKHNRNRQR